MATERLVSLVQSGPHSHPAPPPGTPRRPWLLLTFATSLVILLAWGLIVPPFEGTDESAFYQHLMARAHGASEGSLPLYDLLLRPVIRLTGRPVQPFQTRYNPSFRFVSNERGRVNVFMHGRTQGMAKGDVNRLYLLRLVTSLMWIVGLVLTFETARLWFGRSDLAMLVAVLCVSIPQFSFFGSNIHAESTATLLGTIAYLAVSLRVYDRIGRPVAWLVGLSVVGLAPFADRQAYFLILLVPFALVVSERSWRAAAAAAAVLLIPAVLLVVLPQFDNLQHEVTDIVLGTFSSSYRGGWWNPDNPQYFVFEFVPKIFESFCGWLGQPSILLPAPVYAGMATLLALAAGGLSIRGGTERLTDRQRRLAWILGFGVFVTFAPIVYANILISRNSWYGRWLFPSLGPMMIALVAGMRRLAELARRRPHLVAGVLAGGAAILAVAWSGGPGDAYRAGVRAFHYGDQERVIAAVRDTIAGIGLAAVLVEAAWIVSTRWGRMTVRPLHIAAAALGCNLLLLLGFVQPLYEPLDASGFADAIRNEAAEASYERASALYAIASAAYPGSTELRDAVSANRMVLLAGSNDQQIAELQDRIGRGEQLQTRQELMMLARVARTKKSIEPAVLQRVIGTAKPTPDTAEPLALLRAEFEGRMRSPSASADAVRAGGGVVKSEDMHSQAILEGFTVRPLDDGSSEVRVYVRPLVNWSNRWLWIHAYPTGQPDYLGLEPVPPVFVGWQPGELGWEVFRVPGNARYNCYVGVGVGGNLGPAYGLGWIGR